MRYYSTGIKLEVHCGGYIYDHRIGLVKRAMLLFQPNKSSMLGPTRLSDLVFSPIAVEKINLGIDGNIVTKEIILEMN